MYSQLFNLLCDKADNEYGGRLPVHVRFLLDEFANIGQIPKIDKLIATIRSREISACVVNWTAFSLLSSSNSTFRNDGIGFTQQFITPNHTWGASAK
jgi:hypothetical protein